MIVSSSRSTLSMAGLSGSPLRLSDEQKADYSVRAARPRRHVATVAVAPRTGEAFTIEKDQILRITCIEGPQVCDFNVFAKEDPRERFWSNKSRIVNGLHMTTGSQLWSTPPRVRPMMTIVADTVRNVPSEFEPKTHDLLFTRCDARHYELLFGKLEVPNCQDNLAHAVRKFGIDEYGVHDPLNLFQTTGLNTEGRPFYIPSVAKKGDYVELYADIDCIIAISACPGGSSGDQHYPLRADIYEVADV